MSLNKIRCPKCRGTGLLEFVKLNFFSIFQISETVNCDGCHGKGWIYD